LFGVHSDELASEEEGWPVAVAVAVALIERARSE